MATPSGNLDFGRLLRVQSMVTEAAQTEATYKAAIGLVRAYNGLRDEIFSIVEAAGLQEMRAECLRLFPLLEYPHPFNPNFPIETSAGLEAAASEALLNLRKLGGWIKGLIDEMTFEQRLRIEAEEKAKLEARPPTGFTAGD
jgi:hypothetical protein